jgi:hypothetical protein
MHGLKLFRSSIALTVALAACSDADTAGVEVDSTASAVSTPNATGLVRCATPEPGVTEQDAAETAAANMSMLRVRRGKTQIPVYFHIITTSDGQGDVSDLVPAEMAVLNAAYARAGFKFKLIAIELTENDAWYGAGIGSPEERQMKRALRQGDAGTLNVYTGINDGSLLGWATFPSSFDDQPRLDGIVILDVSLPGGGLEFPDPEEPDGIINYSGGDTLTHEAGHWLGLFHTFQGSCTKKNDQISDTPAEAEPQFICIDRDSCTGKKFPGTDPIHNFMDYVDDDCMDQFTAEQEGRMADQFDAFRG